MPSAPSKTLHVSRYTKTKRTTIMKNLLQITAVFIIINSAFAQAPDSALVEQPDQRTYFSKTYYKPADNTYKTIASVGYVHYLASDGTLKDIDANLRLDKSGAYYIIDSGLYNVAFAAASGQGAYDVAYEVPRPVQPKFYDPGKPPAPVTRIRWKILSYGYFDRQRSTYQILQNARATAPIVSGNAIDYPQIFNGIDVRYNCGNVSVKEELVLSQSARNTLPDPAKYGLSRNNSYFVVAMEFLLTPNNINAFARRQGNKLPIKQGNDFVFDGDESIEFEDENSTLHFFFPKDYAHAAADSTTGFSNRISLRRYFYSQGGKHYMLVGVPWNWINSAPAGDLIIDPTTSVGASDDVWLEDLATGLGGSTQFLIGKAASYPKKRTIIKFNTSSVPTNATVLNAQMKLYYYTAVRVGTTTWVDRWIQTHQVLVNWNEAEATDDYRLTSTLWNVNYVGLNDIDAKSGYESTTLFQQDYPKWKQWDITALTQKWVNLTATNYGVVLWATNETTDGYDLRFYSSEYTVDTTLRPKLEVTWSQLPRTVYFLKDHLGSIRATVQDTSTAPVVGYDDYDPWGYILAGRSLIASGWGTQAGIMKNKFTSKEWDDDYGLNWIWVDRRPYMPDIGRWGVTEPLAGKFPGLSPYVYSFNNPILFFDPNGAFPYTFHIRAFAPPGAFTGVFRGYHDDRRGFSTGLDGTSRIKQDFTIDPTAQTYSGGTPTSDPTRIGSFSRTATNKGGISTPEFGTNIFGSSTATLTSEFAGSNPLAPFSPDIEVGSAISITENLKEGKLFISLDLSSKQFPATEAFVQDNTGQKLFLAGAAAFGNPTDLIDGKKVEVATADLIININNKGVFQNVTFGGKTYSLEEFNKLRTSQSAGPFPR